MRCDLLRRKTQNWWFLMSLLLLAPFSCTPMAHLPPTPEPLDEPTVRVSILQGIEDTFFSASGAFQIIDDQGQYLQTLSPSEGRWSVRVKFGQPADMVYRLVLHEEESMDSALRYIEDLRSRGLGPKIMEVGKVLRQGTRMLNDNRKYLVTIGPFATEQEAHSQTEHLQRGKIRKVVQDISSPALGVLDLIDPQGGVVFSSGEHFTLIPVDAREGRLKIYGVLVGQGFAWERSEDRAYRGRMEFRIGNDGRLLAINELALEDYLKGLLPREMNPGFPPASLRAQAVAARSYTIAKMGIQHRLDPFDLCADVHCQVYGGADREDPVTNRAVDETRGQLLMYGDKVCDCVYSAVCGGHTESSDNVWGGPPVAYLQGAPDAPPGEAATFPKTLSFDEEAISAWVSSAPLAYCNHLAETAPSALRYTRKHFRWSFTFSRQELEEILVQKQGARIGTLLDIAPLARGSSGRLIKVRIVGDAGELAVEKELSIRGALSPTHLPSACFEIEKEIGPDGLPSGFTFRGAGWGHGVGMCQAGAAGMALRGMDYEEILSHYYRGTQVVQMYGVLF